jgi:hypothetical protein
MSHRVALLLEQVLLEVLEPQQNNSIVNLKSWAAANDIQIHQKEKRKDGLIVYQIASINPKLSGIEIFIYPDSAMKISGKVINSQDSFEKTINYLLS